MSAIPEEVVAFRDLGIDDDGDLLERFHRDVLAVAFPPDELDDADTLASGLRGDGDIELLASIAVGSGDAVLGGVVGEVFAREAVLLVSYLAVRPDLRGKGIGTALMQHVAPRWYAHPAIRLAFGEVHDPRVPSITMGDDPESLLRLYGRLGARVLGVPFVQPSLGAGRGRVPGFLLLAFHVDPRIEIPHEHGGRAVPSDLVGQFVRRYYAAAEGVRAPYDPQLAALIGQIEDHPAIPLLRIVDYDLVPLLS